MRRKKILFAVMLLVVSTAISLIIAETALRIFSPQQESARWFESSEKYGHLLKKNFSQDYRFIKDGFVMHVQTNSLGHRFKEYNQADFSNKRYRKVLLLGDSFLFGHGMNMEDHIATNLTRMLNKDAKHFVIINAGVSGWGTLQETAYAKDHFEIFRPDIIVLLFCGNDPDDDNKFLAKMKDRERGIFIFPGKIYLREHSHFYRFIHSRFRILLHHIVLKMKAKNNKNIIIDKQSGNAITREQWTRTLRAIKDFHDEYSEFNKEGLLLILPTAPWNKDHRDKLMSISNGHDLLFIDIYSKTIALQPIERRLPYDAHWSTSMHYLSAKEISELILRLNKPKYNQATKSLQPVGAK